MYGSDVEFVIVVAMVMNVVGIIAWFLERHFEGGK
jgi:hypothetical protein